MLKVGILIQSVVGQKDHPAPPASLPPTKALSRVHHLPYGQGWGPDQAWESGAWIGDCGATTDLECAWSVGVRSGTL